MSFSFALRLSHQGILRLNEARPHNFAAAICRHAELRRCPLVAGPLFSISTNDGYIHLCFNESPYGPSDRTTRAIRDSISAGGRYPADLSYDGLKDQIAKFHGLEAD